MDIEAGGASTSPSFSSSVNTGASSSMSMSSVSASDGDSGEVREVRAPWTWTLRTTLRALSTYRHLIVVVAGCILVALVVVVLVRGSGGDGGGSGSGPVSGDSLVALGGMTFLGIGDWGRQGMWHQKEVAAQMGIFAKKLGASFVVSTGDNFYEGEGTDTRRTHTHTHETTMQGTQHTQYHHHHQQQQKGQSLRSSFSLSHLSRPVSPSLSLVLLLPFASRPQAA
jgi:hypothetical protein